MTAAAQPSNRAKNQARSTAENAKHSEVLDKLTRVGFIGFGVTHLLVAWLALQIAFGQAPGNSDQYGAFQTLVDQPFGKFLLIVVVVGLVAMAIWQLLEAAIGHRDARGKERIAERIVSLGRAAFYIYLVFTAYKILNSSGKSSSAQNEKTTGTLLAEPGGRWLVGLIGVGIVAISVGLAVYGLTKRFERHLKSGEMTRETRKTIRWIGVAGYLAKGVAYATVGMLLVVAATNYDPDKSRGLDGALRTLAEQRWGQAVLAVVAVGIAAYGVFSLAQARYRKI